MRGDSNELAEQMGVGDGDEPMYGVTLDFYCACGAMWEGDITDEDAAHILGRLEDEWADFHTGEGHAAVGRAAALAAWRGGRP